MKIRSGFVSNSSSSSFILALPKKPESSYELQGMLFPNGFDFILDEYYRGDVLPCACNVAATVFRDIKDQEPKTVTELAEELSCGWFQDMPECPSYDYETTSPDERQRIWDNHAIELEKWAAKRIASFIAENPNAVFFVVEYSDNDGSYQSFMEHDGVFDDMPHIRVSKH